MNGLGLANLFMAAYGMYQQHKDLKSQQKDLANVDAEIDGGKANELHASVTEPGKMPKTESYLPSAGKNPYDTKTSGLGFDTSSLNKYS